MIYLFILDDSMNRFTTRTEQLTMCCEPEKKPRVRLWLYMYLTSLSVPVTLYY